MGGDDGLSWPDKAKLAKNANPIHVNNLRIEMEVLGWQKPLGKRVQNLGQDHSRHCLEGEAQLSRHFRQRGAFATIPRESMEWCGLPVPA